MIVKDKNLSFLMLLVEMRGSIVPAIMPHIIISAMLGVVACILLKTKYLNLEDQTVDALKLSFGPFTALGVAISLFLGFHNNASYSRWWEARILWGRQIIVTRDIQRFLLATLADDDNQNYNNNSHHNDDDVEVDCSNLNSNSISNSNKVEDVYEDEWKGTIQLQGIHKQDIESNYMSLSLSLSLSVSESSESPIDETRPGREVIRGWKQNIVRLSCAHTHAFRHQMRPSCKMDGSNTALRDRNRFLTKEEQRKLIRCKNPANSILFMASQILGSAHKKQLIETYSMIHVQKSIDLLCEIQTAAERIHNTSLPLAYSLLVHRTSFLYVLLVPFAIVDAVGWWTPFFTAIVAYTFFGLDRLAKEIQEPMSDRPMCLALSAMCRTIEIDTLEALGKETPPFLKPKFKILM
jgi:predicted membrane chloride channel (bestrophin family)